MSRPADMVSLQGQGVGVDGDVLKGNDSNNHANGHTEHSDCKDDSSSELINRN